MEPAKSAVQFQVGVHMLYYCMARITQSSVQNSHAVISFVSKVVLDFLMRHGFSNVKESEDRGSPEKKRRRVEGHDREEGNSSLPEVNALSLSDLPMSAVGAKGSLQLVYADIVSLIMGYLSALCLLQGPIGPRS